MWQRQGDDGNWYVDRPPPVEREEVTPATFSNPFGKRLPMMVVGFAAGVVGFVGFFVDFFNSGGTSLASSNSGWFELVPIFIGLCALALFLPKYGFLFSGLSMISLGITFGLRGVIAGEVAGHSGTGYGVGFWMITIGSGVLSLAWLIDMWLHLDVETARG